MKCTVVFLLLVSCSAMVETKRYDKVLPEPDIAYSWKKKTVEVVNASMLEKLMAAGREQTEKQCHLVNTISWNSCHKLLHCEGACTSGSDCQFPFCNIQHKCECRKAWCTTDLSCDFFQIGCNGTYSCVDSLCICNRN